MLYAGVQTIRSIACGGVTAFQDDTAPI
ncbi:MAG: hypothetical protein ACJAX1_001322 [Neolewinella sp.]